MTCWARFRVDGYCRQEVDHRGEELSDAHSRRAILDSFGGEFQSTVCADRAEFYSTDVDLSLSIE